MRRLIIVIILITIIPVNAWSAAYTSSQAGNWSESTTWGGGGVPGDGDTATVDHDVTVDTNITVGTSPAVGNVVVTVNGTGGSLTVASGVSLTVRGDLSLNNATLTLGAGSSYLFDASIAGDPNGTHYVINIGTDHNQSSKIDANGTSGSRVTITYVTDNDGGSGYFTNGAYIDGGLLNLEYTTLTGVVNTSDQILNALDLRGSGKTFSLQNCILDGCGSIGFSQCFNGVNLAIDNTTWKNSASTFCLTTTSQTTPTGTRSITGCVFDKLANLYKPYEMTVTGNVFLNRVAFSNTSPSTFSGNFFFYDIDTQTIVYQVFSGTVLNNFVLAGDGIGASPHYLVFSENSTATIQGNIFEYEGSDDNGDCVMPSGPGGENCLITQNIVLPNGGGDSSGSLVSALGGPGTSLTLTNNTYYSTNFGAYSGENYESHTDFWAAFRNNLIWSDGTGYKLRYIENDPNLQAEDVITAANADYNNGYNVAAGSNGKGYDGFIFSSGFPGDHDLAVDPQFVDPNRDLAAWDLLLGGPGTNANAIAELSKLNDSDYDPNYTISGLVAWIKAGFAPQNSDLDGTGYEGADIGAIDIDIRYPHGVMGLSASSINEILGINTDNILKVLGVE